MSAEVRPFTAVIPKEEAPRASFFRRIGLKLKGLSIHFLVAALSIALVIAVLAQRITRTLKSGEAGVMFYQYGSGTDTTTVYGEGTHMLLPWNEMVVYDARLQGIEDSVDALSRNGLEVKVQYSVLFRPVMEDLGKLHQMVGPDYVRKVVVPEASAATRAIISRYNPEELYFRDRDSIRQQVLDRVKLEGRRNYVDFVDIMIRSIHLPPRIKSAIEGKLEQEQHQLEYTYLLSSAEQEAERRRIEAKGIADFEKISGVPILKWRGIEATEKLANSPNSKIVILGKESDELPVIMSEDD